MSDEQKTITVNDLPASQDALDFRPYIETLAEVVASSNTPLTIGVFGSWGSGKTSLMGMVRDQLPENFTVAWFDAWKYDKEETLWRAFLLNVLGAMRKKIKPGENTQDLDYLETMLYRAIDLEKSGGVTIDLLKLGSKVAQGAVQVGLSFIPGAPALGKIIEELQKLGTANISQDALDAIQRERTKIHIEQVRFLEQFQDKFKLLVESRVKPGRLVVFVDDLDRCLPEKAIQVLEAIKLFLDVPDCVFVLGLDKDVIARGIEIKYRELGQKNDGEGKPRFTIEGLHYLEKIIQLPFQIPPVERADMSKFVTELTPRWPAPECPEIFAVGLGSNPRQIKRTVNVFLMLNALARKRHQDKIKPIRLAKVVTLQAIYPELYELLKETPRYLRELEDYYRAEAAPAARELAEGGPASERPQPDAKRTQTARAEPPPALAPYLSRQAVRAVLTMHPPELAEANFSGLAPDELRLYFTLTRSAEAPQAEPPRAPERQAFEPQMVPIPAGKFLMGTTQEQAEQIFKETGNDKNWQQWLAREQPQHEVELSEYLIGKYPITNREYQFFVREGGKAPQGWDDGQYPPDKGDHPVVSVSWNDAQAYGQWLSQKTGKHYRLPTEAEWEKAARGDDGRIYPWGDQFDPTKANIDETKIGDTSPVGQFSPQGDSPFGCADMSGNVWEWCADWFDENEYKKRKTTIKEPPGPEKGSLRVLRGGSFNLIRLDARCARRGGNSPDYNFRNYGFRLVLLPSLNQNSDSLNSVL
jgi:formylglycine-generating enzyme required for sulfatase activity